VFPFYVKIPRERSSNKFIMRIFIITQTISYKPQNILLNQSTSIRLVLW